MNSQFQWKPGIRGRGVSSTGRKAASGEERNLRSLQGVRTTGIVGWKELAKPLSGINNSEIRPFSP
jgi:hypothetical protein